MKHILKINKAYKFGYAVISDNKDVYLFNESVIDYSCSRDYALVNVEVLIDKAGLLHIKGDQLIWRLAINKINLSDIEEPVSDKSIRYSKGNKFFGIKPMEYVEGWYRLKNPKPAKYMLSNFKIIIKE